MPSTIRFLVPDDEIAWDDAVHGRISFQGRDLDDFVILRSDGSAIYNMAVVSDDIAMDITHVIRGDDHISNTPKQIALYRALGHELPVFAHVPMILGPDGKKLSKRHGATAVGDYQDQGILAPAMRNFLALLGWSPGGDREIVPEEEMIQLFTLEGIQKKAAVFDTTKLEWMNGQYLSALPAEELLAPVRRRLEQIGVSDGGRDLRPLIDSVKARSRTILHVADQVAVRLDPSRSQLDEKGQALIGRWDPPSPTNLVRAADALETPAERRLDRRPPARAASRAWRSPHGLKLGDAMQPIRVALTGSTVSEPVNELLEVVGPERSLARMREVAGRERRAGPPREGPRRAGARGPRRWAPAPRRRPLRRHRFPPPTAPHHRCPQPSPPAAAVEPPPPPRISRSVRLAFAGDINLGTLTVPGGVPPREGRGLFDASRHALTGDLVVGNFEGVLGDSGTTYKCGRQGKHVTVRRHRDARSRPPGAKRKAQAEAGRRPAHVLRLPHPDRARAAPGRRRVHPPQPRQQSRQRFRRATPERRPSGSSTRSASRTYGPLGSIAMDTVRRGDSLTDRGPGRLHDLPLRLRPARHRAQRGGGGLGSAAGRPAGGDLPRWRRRVEGAARTRGRGVARPGAARRPASLGPRGDRRRCRRASSVTARTCCAGSSSTRASRSRTRWGIS